MVVAISAFNTNYKYFSSDWKPGQSSKWWNVPLLSQSGMFLPYNFHFKITSPTHIWPFIHCSNHKVIKTQETQFKCYQATCIVHFSTLPFLPFKRSIPVLFKHFFSFISTPDVFLNYIPSKYLIPGAHNVEHNWFSFKRL